MNRLPTRITFHVDRVPLSLGSGKWEVTSPQMSNLQISGLTIPEALKTTSGHISHMMEVSYHSPDAPSIFHYDPEAPLFPRHESDFEHRDWNEHGVRVQRSDHRGAWDGQNQDKADLLAMSKSLSRVFQSTAEIHQMVERIHSRGPGLGEQILKEVEEISNIFALSSTTPIPTDVLSNMMTSLDNMAEMVKAIHAGGVTPPAKDYTEVLLGIHDRLAGIFGVLDRMQTARDQSGATVEERLTSVFNVLDRMADTNKRTNEMHTQMLSRLEGGLTSSINATTTLLNHVSRIDTSTQDWGDLLRWARAYSENIDQVLKNLSETVATMMRIIGGDRGASFIKMVIEATSSLPEFTHDGTTWVRKSLVQPADDGDRMNCQPG